MTTLPLGLEDHFPQEWAILRVKLCRMEGCQEDPTNMVEQQQQQQQRQQRQQQQQQPNTKTKTTKPKTKT